MREDEIASLPTEEERRREVRFTVSIHPSELSNTVWCNPACTVMTSMVAACRQ